jgi:hypothetical protein
MFARLAGEGSPTCLVQETEDRRRGQAGYSIKYEPLPLLSQGFGTPFALIVTMTAIRRIFLRHTTGPYPGLVQMIGVFTAENAEMGQIPDVLPPHPQPPAALWPDGRLGKALRLKSTDRYVMYQEQAGEAVADASEPEGVQAAPEPTDRPADPTGQGRTLLNEYGRHCWELGFRAGQGEPA